MSAKTISWFTIAFPPYFFSFRKSPPALPKHQEIVRLIPSLSGVRLRMSVVVASRRCERLTQEYWGQYRIPKSSIKNSETLTTQQRVPAHPAKSHSQKFLSRHDPLHKIFLKNNFPKNFPGISTKNLSGTRDERPVRDFFKNAASHLSQDSCIQSPRHAADPQKTETVPVSDKKICANFAEFLQEKFLKITHCWLWINQKILIKFDWQHLSNLHPNQKAWDYP